MSHTLLNSNFNFSAGHSFTLIYLTETDNQYGCLEVEDFILLHVTVIFVLQIFMDF